MNKFILILCGLLSSQASFALSGPAYMERFNTYMALSQNLPLIPGQTFDDFINGDAPLSKKLREKWLYQLARNKDWIRFNQYYQPSTDINLLCYAQLSKYQTGAHQEAINGSTNLWLSGESQPPACNTLFELLLKDDGFNQNLITQRIALALDKGNYKLAHYLIKQYKKPHPEDLLALDSVHQNPRNISKLRPGEVSGEIYLYGLKRQVAMNMDKALLVWNENKSKTMLNQKQQQNFIAHIALYKAMRNNEDAAEWFAKVKPEYYNDVLVDWQIRLALKHNNWKRVAALINDSKNKDAPSWQYWLARSLEEQGKIEEAKAVYEPLAKSRQYYGFLASLRLKQKPSFINENPVINPDILKPYQAFTDQVKTLYQNKNLVLAAQMLNAFISELDKDEASALVYWVDNTLQWHDRSIYLSSNDLLTNQLSLRFPLAYKNAVTTYAKKYAVPSEFIFAIIRQESSFKDDATSSAGARGLMQVMPYTASAVSKADKISYNHKDQLFLSEKNINIGVAYLKQLSKRFSQHPILIAAAYNAGPKQVVYWLRSHPPKEIDVWIETLPWQETRNYLKNVMAFYVVYQYRLNQKPNLKNFLEPLAKV